MKQTRISVLAVLLALTMAACAKTEPAAPTEPVTEVTTEAAVEETAEPTQAQKLGFVFETVDVYGNPVDESILEGHSLIMVNLWEPWCGPCVGEMPDLERLSQDYADRGLLLLGVYATEDGVDKVLQETGVTYPIIRYVPEFYPFTTPYVPTTVFLTEKGDVVRAPEPGARSYEAWAELVEELLP